MWQGSGIGRDGEFRAARADRPQGIDPEWLSSTIGSIYDCVLQPERWPGTIETIAAEFSFASVVLGILQVRPGAHELKAHVGFDEEYLAIGDTYAEDSVRIWGGASLIEAFPLDEPIVASDITPLAEFWNLRYYREILEPRGLIDAVFVTLAREPQLVGYLAMNRHVSVGDVRPHELQGLRLLAPHLRRAVTISNFFDLQSVENKTFGSVLDSISCAVVLVDEDLGVVHANRAAAAMLAAGEPIRSVQGRLSVGGGLPEDSLRSAVRLAAENEALLGQRGIGIPAQSKGDAPAVLHVLPLQRGEIRSGLVQRAVAAVFVVSADRGANTPVDAISMLYDLTPTEGQIFASLSKGQSLAKTADALGIAKSTARTHLLRVFDKTGCKRQAELVVLASRLSLTL
jgi:DNA-binding CsgD family transcriptional regulator/PAS domain-containing protein